MVCFRAETDLKGLRFDPDGSGSQLEIDAIVLAAVHGKPDFEKVIVHSSLKSSSKS